MLKNTGGKLKVATLFEHLRQITQTQDPDYFKKLTDADKKSWSTFMILRYLSMNENWTEIINEIQPYTTSVQLKPELVYQILIRIIPPSNIYLPYIKGKNEGKYEKELINTFMLFYSISNREAIDYLNILYSKLDGLKEVRRILSMYGFDEKEIKKLTKLKEKK
jgi:hypothetical protein